MTLKRFKIGDICLTTDFVANGSFASLKENVKYLNNDGYAILVRLTDFIKHWKKSFRYVSKHAYKFLKHSKLFPGDLVISSVGEPGKTFLVPNLGKPMTLGPNSVLVRPDNKILSTQYLKYFIDSDFGQELIKSIVTGAAQRKFNKTSLRNLEITIPALEEQQRIVAKLDAALSEIDKTIAIKKSTKENIEKLKNSILNNLLNKNFLNTKIGNICELIYGKGLPKENRVNENGIPAYGANGIKCYAAEPLYNGPSIIIGRKGSAGELQWVDNPFWALDVTYYVLPNEKKVNLKFLYYLLQMQNLPKLAKGIKPGINRNEVYNINIKLPTIDEQIKITDRLEKIFKQQKILKKLNDRINVNYHSLKSAIITKEIKHKAA
jgi:type I restriction enzyme, S subunit